MQVLGRSSPVTTVGVYTQSAEESHRSTMLKLEELMFPFWIVRPGRVQASKSKAD